MVSLQSGDKSKRRGRRLLWFVIAAMSLFLLAGIGVFSLIRELPSWRRTWATEDAIAEFRRGVGDDSEVIALEEVLIDLGSEAIEVLTREVQATADIRLFKVFDGLDPRGTRDSMRRLIDHEDPEIRHGALLSLSRQVNVDRKSWREILQDPTEDRFIRQLAAHQIGLAPGWWREFDPGSVPVAPLGMGKRRVTFLRERVTLGEMIDEIAWVTGGKVVCPENSRGEPLESVFYFHVPLEGMLADTHHSQQYGVYRTRIDGAGNIEVSRSFSDE